MDLVAVDDSKCVAEGGAVQLRGSCRSAWVRIPKKGTTNHRDMF